MLRRLLLGLPVVAAAAVSAVLLTRPDTAPGCSAGVPVAWQRAYTAPPVHLGALRPALPVGRLGTDWLVVDRATRGVFRVSEDGTQHLLYSPGAGEAVTHLGSEGRHVVLQLGTDRVEVVDATTGRAEVLQQVAAPAVVDSLMVTHGSAYWVDRADPTSRRARGHRYVLASGRQVPLGDRLQPAKYRVSQGGSAQPRIVDDGTEVVWLLDYRVVNVIDRFPPPAPVRRVPLPTDPSNPMLTDGTSYAWRFFGIEYWTPGMAEPKATEAGSYVPDEVHGPLVALHDVRTHRPAVLDTRSGAIAAVPASFTTYGGLTVSAKEPGTLYRVEPSELPVLRC